MKLRSIFNKPTVLMLLFFAAFLHATIFLFSYVYIEKSKRLFYSQAFSQLQSITDLKHYELNSYFNELFLDLKAISQTQCIEDFVEDVKALDKKAFNKKNLQTIYTKHSNQLNYINNFVKHHEHTDIFFINTQNNQIFYTLNSPELLTKEIDSKNNSDMLVMLKNMYKTQKTQVLDMHIFSLKDYDKPNIAIATPVVKENKTLAILLLVIPNTDINNMVKYRTGMGKTGESYIVGMDKRLRSNSYLVKDFTVKNLLKKDSDKRIDTPASRRALEGKSGMDIILDYRGVEVLSVYKPFEFNNLKWAVISEIDSKEINKQFENIKNNILFISGFIAVVLTVLGYFTLRYIINNTVVFPLKRSYNKAKEFQDIVDNSLNEIFIFDKESFKFIYVNKSAQKNTGYSLDEMMSMTPVDIKPRYNMQKFLKIIQPLIQSKKGQITFETIHMRKDGSTYDVEIRLQFMQFKNKEYYVAIINDITDRNKALKQKEFYYERSTHDYLTQTYNRQYFDELYDVEIERAKRYKHPISLILFDIDDFKKINDSFGHDFGDKVLVKLSSLVKDIIRDSDVFARWGGEEFIILMPHSDLKQAMHKAQEIRAAIANLKIDDLDQITCSFGVIQIDEFKNAHSSFKKVDQALYQAKANGKNRVETL